MPDTVAKNSKTQDSRELLKRRWGDEALLDQAALRREHLNYQTLHFGALDADKEYLISLLPQIHNTYYMGHFQACIAICGTFLETALCKRICWELEQKGFLEFKPHGPQRPSQRLETAEDVQELSYQNYLGIVKFRRWLSHEEYQDLQNVRHLRNQAVHKRVPVFCLAESSRQGSVYRLELDAGYSLHEIEIPARDVEAIAHPPEQIAAWYCLSRSRRIVRSLLKGMQGSKE